VNVSLYNVKKDNKGEIMKSNKSKRFVNVVAGAIAAAGILSGGALGLAAGAHAETATTAQAHQERVADAQAHDTQQFAETGHETDQRKGAPTRPVEHRPSPPTEPGQHPTQQRPR
jgi:hypothetical protein